MTTRYIYTATKYGSELGEGRSVCAMIRVSDLPDQSAALGPRTFPGCYPPPALLLCRVCSEEYSAHRGDYFTHKPDEVLKCCGKPLALVRKETRYVEVTVMNSCDHGHDTPEEVRLLPLSRNAYHGNVIVCRYHHGVELRFREDRAKVTGRDKWDFPTWDSLPIYAPVETCDSGGER